MATSGKKHWPPMGRTQWPLTYAKAYAKAAKKDKGRVLDEVVGVTGWSRDNARRRLTAAAKTSPGAGRQVAVVPRKQRAPKYSYDARKVLQVRSRVQAVSRSAAPGGVEQPQLVVVM